jgi:predicted RNA methylase
MRLKELQSLLQGVRGFSAPKQDLEQYITGASVAAGILFSVRTAQDVASCHAAANL